MFVRKRKAARKKRKLVENGSAEPSMPEEYAGEEDGDGDAHRDTPSYAEHQFAFAAFEKVSERRLHAKHPTDVRFSDLRKKRWSTH